MFDGKILDIYPCEIINIVYYGKRVSYKEVLKTIGNDLKYESLKNDIDNNSTNSFFNLGLNKGIDKEELRKKLEAYKSEYNEQHYCLFTLPNNFSPSAL